MSLGDQLFLITLSSELDDLKSSFSAEKIDFTIRTKTQAIGVNKRALTENSTYFQRLFQSGLKEAQDNEINLSEHEDTQYFHDDVIIKMLRLAHEKQFDPFDSKLSDAENLTEQLIRGLTYFEMSSFIPTVMSFTPDQQKRQALTSLFQAADISYQRYEITGSPSDKKASSDITTLCQTLTANLSWEELIKALGPEYFRDHFCFLKVAQFPRQISFHQNLDELKSQIYKQWKSKSKKTNTNYEAFFSTGISKRVFQPKNASFTWSSRLNLNILTTLDNPYYLFDEPYRAQAAAVREVVRKLRDIGFYVLDTTVGEFAGIHFGIVLNSSNKDHTKQQMKDYFKVTKK